MNRDDENKRPASATISDKKPTNTEAEYLAQQANEARTAIGATLKSVAASSGRLADPRGWARSYPWATVAVTAAAGFAVALAAVPSREQQELRRLAEFERIKNQKPVSTGNGTSKPSRSMNEWIMLIVMELFGMAKPALLALMESYLGQWKKPPEPKVSSRERGVN